MLLSSESPARFFPHPSTKIFPVPVTNNLDRGYEKRKLKSVRQHFLQSEGGRKSPANSFIHKILPVTPYASRFCGDRPGSPSPNLNRIIDLEISQKKFVVQPLPCSLALAPSFFSPLRKEGGDVALSRVEH